MLRGTALNPLGTELLEHRGSLGRAIGLHLGEAQHGAQVHTKTGFLNRRPALERRESSKPVLVVADRPERGPEPVRRDEIATLGEGEDLAGCVLRGDEVQPTPRDWTRNSARIVWTCTSALGTEQRLILGDGTIAFDQITGFAMRRRGFRVRRW